MIPNVSVRILYMASNFCVHFVTEMVKFDIRAPCARISSFWVERRSAYRKFDIGEVMRREKKSCCRALIVHAVYR